MRNVEGVGTLDFCKAEIAPLPYKCDRIVFLFYSTMVVIVDLFLRRANAVRPYRCVAVRLWV